MNLPRKHRGKLPLYIKIGVVMITNVLMFSCASNEPTDSAGYFRIDKLLKQQVMYLSQTNAKIQKQSSLGDTSAVKSYHPGDTVAWKHELAILTEIDEINNPSASGLYLVDTALTDLQSNLKVNVFTATANLPVKSLRIFYQDHPSKIRKIEAVVKEENYLYTSIKNLTLQFSDIDMQNVLTAYSVAGMQKMYLKDSIQYNIAVKITLAN